MTASISNILRNLYSKTPPGFLDRYSIGFDDHFKSLAEGFSDSLEAATKIVSSSWPPFNVKKIEDNKYVIECAVAGFSKNDLILTLEDNVLTIEGNSGSSEENNDDFLYKGIAERNFKQKFKLSNTVVVKDAQMINGLLRVVLENVVPEKEKSKTIPINDGSVNTTSKVLLNE